MLCQKYSEPFEIVIVANNCDDSLFSYLQKFDDPKIRLYRTSIGQLAFNLNFGIDKAKGDFIIRMDADDVCFPERLSITEKVIKEYNSDVIGFSANLINEGNQIVGEKVNKNVSEVKLALLYKNPIIHPSAAIRKSALLKVGGYLGGRQSEDYDLWLRLLHNKDIKFFMSSKKVISYRISEGQSKGSILPYCEVAGYFLREFLLSYNPKFLLATCLSIIKRLLLPFKG
jgi:glycosyltransferase involved in cell wall biosynthesis